MQIHVKQKGQLIHREPYITSETVDRKDEKICDTHRLKIIRTISIRHVYSFNCTHMNNIHNDT